MGCMVGGDDVDRAVADCLLDGLDIGGGAKRRIHLRVGVVPLNRILGQREMMRADFCRHPYAAVLSPPNQLDRAARAHVAEVHVTTRPPSEEDVADDHDLLSLVRYALETEPRTDDAFVHRSAVREGR